MGRLVLVLIGAVAGLALAGIVVAVAIPALPVGGRSAGAVWAATALIVGGGVGLAMYGSRSPKP